MPVRISDKMPAAMEDRRALDVRLWQTITAIRCLRDKGVVTYTARDLIGEIDQRLPTNAISPMLNILHNRGLLKCLTPLQKKHRCFEVLSWSRLDRFQLKLEHYPEKIEPKVEWAEVQRSSHTETCENDHFYEGGEMPEGAEIPIEVTEEFPIVHENGRKKVGWFKRWFTNAELVEEQRETNRRLEKLLEVWQ